MNTFVSARRSPSLLVMSLALQVGAAQLSSMVITETKMIGLDIAMLVLSTLLVLMSQFPEQLFKLKLALILLSVAPVAAIAGWWASSSRTKDLVTYPWWILFMRFVCLGLFAMLAIAILT